MSPNDRKYTREHEWVLIEDQDAKRALAGITDFAQEQLGDIVFFELPKGGETLTHMGKMGEVESVKAVSDLFSPVDGKVIEVNERLVDHPEIVNNDPFGEGWLIRITVADVNAVDQLMPAEEYDEFVAGQH